MKMRKWISALCAVALLVSALPAASAEQPSEPHYDDEYQEQAILAYNVLLDYFGRDDAGFPDYPDDFGGAYYDGECLVVLTTASLSEKQEFYENLLAPYSIEVKPCEFSYNELNENGRAFAKSLDVPLVQYGVDEKNNNFNIVVDGEENLNKLQNCAMPLSASTVPIVFEAGSPIKTTASLVGGGELVYKAGGTAFSVGLCGTWKGRSAVLTCGHGFAGMGASIRHVPVYNGSNVKIGTLESFSYGPNYGTQTTGDWAIILLDDSTTPTNEVFADFSGNTYKITQKAMSVPAGTKIWGSGTENRSYWGIVKETGCFVNVYSDVVHAYVGLDGMTTSNYITGNIEDGDSGGTHYFVSNGENTFYGTLVGNNESGNSFVTSPYYWATNFAPKTN